MTLDLVPDRAARSPGRATHPRPLALAALGWLLLCVRPMPVWAATELLDPSVTPAAGTTATTFTASVIYRSDPEGRPAATVSVEFVGVGILPMALVAGTATDGTWQTQTMLPAGSWPTVFSANPSGSDPDPIAGPTVTVSAQPTPRPSPTPIPTPASTPRPTVPPSPVPTALPTNPPSPGTSPRPRPTPAPTAAARSPSPATPTPDDTASPGAPGSPPPSSSDASSSIGPTATPGDESTPPTSGAPTASPDSPDPGPSSMAGAARGVLVLFGGAIAGVGAVILAGAWRARRRAGRPSPVTPPEAPRREEPR